MYKRHLPKPPVGVTEFEILKASHKFLRDEEDAPGGPSHAALTTTNGNTNNSSESGNTSSSWNDQLAAKYYASLYREFALCDLKHYKSGNFALRWRTEDEVVSGAGETTCGNTRCEDHLPPASTPKIPLTTLELPFGYVEHEKSKSALVKVVLCGRCLKKLMWKRNREKETQDKVVDSDGVRDGNGVGGDGEERPGKSKRKREGHGPLEEEKHRLGRRSRSQLRGDQSVGERHNHNSSHALAAKDEVSDRVGKRRRS